MNMQNYWIYIFQQNPIMTKTVEKRVLLTFLIKCFDVFFFTSLSSNLFLCMLKDEEHVWRRKKKKVVSSLIPVRMFHAMKLADTTMKGPGIRFLLYLNIKQKLVHSTSMLHALEHFKNSIYIASLYQIVLLKAACIKRKIGYVYEKRKVKRCNWIIFDVKRKWVKGTSLEREGGRERERINNRLGTYLDVEIYFEKYNKFYAF